MGRDVPRGLAHHIRDLTGLWRTDARSDGELLAAFTAGDGAAFAALVVRHGQPVWMTCLRMLGNDADAEDAFQATFIALARKAAQVRPETIAGWLQKVSCEVALNARKAAQRRVAAQRRLFEQASPKADEPAPTAQDEELRTAVADELARLPERFRVPLALYYLEGKTQAEIGCILGVTDRAAAHRLKQGLKLLRERLTRRGVVVAASVLAAVLGNVPAAVAVPKGLVASTTEVALTVASGGPTDSLAAQLALEATRASSWVRLKLCVLLLIPALGVVASGVFLAQHPGQAAPPELPRSIVASAPTADASPKDRFGDPLPAGAVTRFGTLRFRTGNPGGVSSVAFGPSGKALISVHGGDSVSFWDLQTGQEVRKLDGPSGCCAVSATPDGKRLAAVGATEVCAWDLSGDAPKLLWKTQSKSVGPSTVEFSPDGKLIACGGDASKEIRLLDATNGSISLLISSPGCRFAFSADSKLLASWMWSRSGEVCVWETSTGNKRYTLTAGDEREVVSSVAFSPDGKSLATVGQDKRLRVWNAEKGTELHKLAEDADPNSFVGFDLDGTLVEVGGGRVRYWNAKTGR
jgi:RNA polymerase sigma factor (sigma-70 family)